MNIHEHAESRDITWVACDFKSASVILSKPDLKLKVENAKSKNKSELRNSPETSVAKTATIERADNWSGVSNPAPTKYLKNIKIRY